MLPSVKQLIDNGVCIPNPESIDIGPEVDLDRIAAAGVTIYSGVKIYGKETLICKGAKLGYEAPVTIENCHIGPFAALKGGFFKEAVFLKEASVGSGAHIREGTILEEGANCAHTVGLKQTILFPFVTLGSLINFCDCFMAGGTSRNDHSEVGSSYIHFNYTPNQDKATASLIGDVPNGVMLDQLPIFLGGQGGLVGPARLAFGTIIAAGAIYRKDELRPGMLLFEGGGQGGKMPFSPGLYRNVKRSVYNGLIYIGNLMALRQWYQWVRAEFVCEEFPEALLAGLKQTLDKAIAERIARLKGLRDKMPRSIERYTVVAGKNASAALLAQKNELYAKWPEIEASFAVLKNEPGDQTSRDLFLDRISRLASSTRFDYIQAIKSLEKEIKNYGVQWLSSIVAATVNNIANHLPSFGISM